jgi:hypothetical protein
MDDGQFIWCRNCGAIHHVSALIVLRYIVLPLGKFKKNKRSTIVFAQSA